MVQTQGEGLAVGHAPTQHFEQAGDDLANTTLMEACILSFLDPVPFFRAQSFIKILR